MTEILHQLFLVATIGALFLIIPMKSGSIRIGEWVERAKDATEKVSGSISSRKTEPRLYKGRF